MSREKFGKIIRKHFDIRENLSKQFHGGPKNIYNEIFIKEPTLQVFRPTLEEMESFSEYLKEIERKFMALGKLYLHLSSHVVNQVMKSLHLIYLQNNSKSMRKTVLMRWQKMQMVPRS